MRYFSLLLVFLFSGLAGADTDEAFKKRAVGLVEKIVAVDLKSGMQKGVLSLKKGSRGSPTKLAILLPGGAAVIRPEISDGILSKVRLAGNFLIRSRRHLVSDEIATLIVDCRSDLGDECRDRYQASPEREADVFALVEEVVRLYPSIEKIWLVGTSRGTISSGFMALHGGNRYAGSIHTATLSEPFQKGSSSELSGLDYSASNIPQVFIHHKDDPCALTTYSGIKKISKKFSIPLVTVTGEKNLSGPACHGFTQHGFRGKEKQVMQKIRQIIVSGNIEEVDVN
jgi:hypothetical protein